MERRDFIKSAVASAVTAGATLSDSGQAQSSARTSNPVSRPMSPDMQYRDLGRTGEKVSVIGLGGYHLGRQAHPAESERLVRTAIDRGITFMDNCWDYNDGISEVRMGQALRDGYRSKVFLMTKMDGRTKTAYNLQLEQSLGRLQTDTIDLVQFHEVIRMEDPDRIFAPG
jgi:aryl-alcohol dehydrogenase-like predicted oxidoreductase